MFFICDISFSHAYNFISTIENSNSISKNLGTMNGFGINIGSLFEIYPAYFVEWDFFNVYCGIGANYFESFHGMHAEPEKIFKSSTIGMDATVTQCKFGKYIADNVTLYGIFSPFTILMANVEGQCSCIPNFGFTLGAGGRWYFYKNLGLQIEWSFVKSYYAKDWRNRGVKYDYHTKLSINRFSLGLCAKL